jgi:hypothetical protein
VLRVMRGTHDRSISGIGAFAELALGFIALADDGSFTRAAARQDLRLAVSSHRHR